jgi:hypothetical protein
MRKSDRENSILVKNVFFLIRLMFYLHYSSIPPIHLLFSLIQWLLLKIQEYPANKEMLRLIEKDLGPSAAAVREVPGVPGYGRPTESKALKAAELKRRIEEVDRALEIVPAEYRAGILYHTLNHGTKTQGIGLGSSWSEPMYSIAHRNTWTKWKMRFLLEYADIIGERDHIGMLIEYGPELENMGKNVY